MTPADVAARPRVEGEREQEILEAALDVLAEVGYDRLTMDAVAAAARASKATLYRRWETKASLVLEAVLAHKGEVDDDPDTGTLRGDLIATYCGHGGLTDAKQISMFSSLITALGRDAEFAEGFRTKFVEPKIERSRLMFERAERRGEIRPDIDADLMGAALAGIVLHRQFILGESPTVDSITRAIDQIILPAVLNHSTHKDHA